MSDVICPRFSPGPWTFTGECLWDRHPDNTCAYCGSMNPDAFMERVEAGTVALGATDKSYKVYVTATQPPLFKQTFRDCPMDARCTPETCTHWVTREVDHQKFYFRHLGIDQRKRFVELFNAQALKFEGGISFYALPFFMRRGAP